MTLIEKVAALLHGLSEQQIAELSPAARERLAHEIQRVDRLIGRVQAPRPSQSSGVLLALRQGARAE